MSREDLISVLIINQYYRYDINLSNFLLAGFIEGNPIGWVHLDVSGIVRCWLCESFHHDREQKFGHGNHSVTMNRNHIRYVDIWWLGELGVTNSECNMRQTFAGIREHGTFRLKWFSYVRA